MHHSFTNFLKLICFRSTLFRVQSMHVQAPGESSKVTHESQQPDCQRHVFSPGREADAVASSSSLPPAFCSPSPVLSAAAHGILGSLLQRQCCRARWPHRKVIPYIRVRPVNCEWRLFGARFRVRCKLRGSCQLGCSPSAIHKTPPYTPSAARSSEPNRAHSEPPSQSARPPQSSGLSASFSERRAADSVARNLDEPLIYKNTSMCISWAPLTFVSHHT